MMQNDQKSILCPHPHHQLFGSKLSENQSNTKKSTTKTSLNRFKQKFGWKKQNKDKAQSELKYSLINLGSKSVELLSMQVMMEENRKKNKHTTEKKIKDLLFHMNFYGMNSTIKQVTLALKYHPDLMRIDSQYDELDNKPKERYFCPFKGCEEQIYPKS